MLSFEFWKYYSGSHVGHVAGLGQDGVMGKNEDHGIQDTQDCRTSCLVCLSLNFLTLKTKNDDNTYLGRLP